MNRSLLGYPKFRDFNADQSRFPQRWGMRNFPWDADRISGSQSASLTPNVNLPTDLAVGDILLALIGVSPSAVSHSLAGFTNMAPYGASGTVGGSLWYRVVDGTEGASVVLTQGASVAMSYVVWRVTNGFTGAAPKFTQINGDRTPPLLNPGRGHLPYLWFRMEITNASLGTQVGWSNQESISFMGGDSRQELIDQLDPPNFSGTTSNARAYTIAIAPKDTPVY